MLPASFVQACVCANTYRRECHPIEQALTAVSLVENIAAPTLASSFVIDLDSRERNMYY